MTSLNIGKKVNMLTVLKEDDRSPKGKGREARYICRCDCGEIVSKRKSSLVHKTAYSCGCVRRLQYDLANKRFGRLLVMESAGLNFHKEMFWKCRCDCGNEIGVNSYALRKGHTKSCGCLKSEEKADGLKKLPHFKRLMACYGNMKTRCYNPDYSLFDSYGGKGICVCDEWKNSFIAFYNWAVSNGYSDTLTLDRINNAEGYSPDNCRWASMQAQQNNRTNNRILTINGISDTMANWARRANADYAKVQTRLSRGFSDEEAVYGKARR